MDDINEMLEWLDRLDGTVEYPIVYSRRQKLRQLLTRMTEDRASADAARRQQRELERYRLALRTMRDPDATPGRNDLTELALAALEGDEAFAAEMKLCDERRRKAKERERRRG